MSTSRPCTRVSRSWSANVRYARPEPKSTTRSGPGGSAGTMSSTSSTNRLTWRNFAPPLRRTRPLGDLDAERDEEGNGLPLREEVALRAIVCTGGLQPSRVGDGGRAARRGRPVPASPRRARGVAPAGSHRRSSREERHERLAVEVLVGRARLVVSADAPASFPHGARSGRPLSGAGATGSATRRRLSVAPVSVASTTRRSTSSSTLTPARATTQTSWPLAIRPPGATATSRTMPTRARRSRSPSSSPRRRTAAGPASTASPSATSTLSTVPCIGLTTAPSPPRRAPVRRAHADGGRARPRVAR